MRRMILGLVLILAAVVPSTPRAASFTVSGLTFSDEMGGFSLISVSGSGTLLDPIVIVEEITGMGAAVLVVRGARERTRSRVEGVIAPPSSITLAVIKVVLNGSDRPWAGFDLELRESEKKPSTYGDGLSFDQLGIFAGPVGSNRFARGRRVDEPFDRVSFRDGHIDPGAAGRFNFFITDPTPTPRFFLRQIPLLLIAERPAPPPQLALRPGR